MRRRKWVALALLIGLLFPLSGCALLLLGGLDTIEPSPAQSPSDRPASGVTFPSGISAQETSAPPSHTDGESWAIYWYLCGTDLETDNGYASKDLDEILSVSLPANVTVVIQTGGTYDWQNDEISNNEMNRFVYDSDGFRKVDEQRLTSMGSPDTLADFLIFCDTYYPADRQGAILWNHGGGSVSGVAFDERFDDDSLTLDEIEWALNAAVPASSTAPPFEFIGFDACLMATVEMAEALRGFTRYMIASEELEPSLGWDYKGMLWAIAQNPAIDGESLGRVICDTYYEACEWEGIEEDVTLSLVDITSIDTLLAAYYNLGVEALTGAVNDPSYLVRYRRAAEKTEKYGYNSFWEGYTNMIDVGDFAKSAGDLLPETADSLLAALERCVLYQVTGPLRQSSTGLSCFYPLEHKYSTYEEYVPYAAAEPYVHLYAYSVSGRLPQSSYVYVEQMQYQSVPQQGTQQPVQTPPPAPDVAPIQPANPPVMPAANEMDLEDYPVDVIDGTATLNLGPQIVQNLVGVYFNVTYISVDGDMLLMLGSDNDLEMDWQNGVFSENFYGYWGCIDGYLAYMELTYENDQYSLYSIPILLNGEEYSLRVAYYYEEDEFSVLGARRGLDDTGMADRNLRQLMPGDVVTTLHYVMSMEEGDDELYQVEVDTFTVTADTDFYYTDLGDGEFVLMFEMLDAYGNSYLSEVVWMTVEGDTIYVETLDD